MTREEAVKILKSKMDGSVDTSYEWAEAVRMAIEALKAPTESTNTPTNAPIDLISRQGVYHILEKTMIDRPLDSDRWVIRDIDKAIRSLPSAEPLVLTCDGCRHVGTYDTDFPCSVCIRREKDYYEQER